MSTIAISETDMKSLLPPGVKLEGVAVYGDGSRNPDRNVLKVPTEEFAALVQAHALFAISKALVKLTEPPIAGHAPVKVNVLNADDLYELSRRR